MGTLLLLLLGSLPLTADSYKGYLITKNNYHLTGFVNTVTYTPFAIMVTFTNDFGNEYEIHPALVRGFAFRDGEEVVVYVSRYYQGWWYFLRVLHDGEVLSLFEASQTDKWISSPYGTKIAASLSRYWLQLNNREIKPMRRVGFRRQLRRFLGDDAKALEDDIRIDKLRYRDLLDIVKSYNEIYKRRRKRT